MGIFDFFKRKSSIGNQKENEQEPDEKQSLKFEEIEGWFLDRKKEAEKKEQKIIKEIEALISQLILEFNEEIKEIEKVDLKNDKRADERVKIIVLENLANYSRYVNALIESLTKLKKGGLQEIINDINKKFIEFKQKSNLSFEKATFLVGKELEKPKESIRNFFEQLNNLAEENKEIFENSNRMQTIEQKISEIKILENSKKGIAGELKEIEKIILRKESEEKILEDEIKKIKNSEEYAEWEKRRQESNLKKKEIERELFEVKSMIDWKNLASIFHINEKKMNLIKEYETHFSQILEKDGEKIVIELLQEANIETQKIYEKIWDIKKKTKEVHEILNSKDKLGEHASGIMGIRAEIKNLLSEKEKILKIIQKIDENICGIKKEINLNIEKFGISIE